MSKTRPWVVEPDGLVVTLRLTPKAGRDGFDAVATLGDGRAVLKARVRAAPSEGEANAALVRLLSKALNAPVSRIAIVSGASARIKRVRIVGDGPALAAAMGKIVGEAR